jgi:hypothetical protein
MTQADKTRIGPHSLQGGGVTAKPFESWQQFVKDP